MPIEEADVFQNLADDLAHVGPLEAKEELLLADCLEILILQAVLHREFEDLSIDAAAFQIEFALLGAYVLEEVAHQEKMDHCDVFHLNSEDAIDACDQTIRVLAQMIQVSWKGLDKHFLLGVVHRLHKESPVKRREHEASTLAS